MEKPLWKPSQEQVQNATVTRFRDYVNDQWNLSLNSFQDLYAWSVQKTPQFWVSFLEFSHVITHDSGGEIVRDFHDMEKSEWFPGIKLNFAENLLRFRDKRAAIVFCNESGERQIYTFAELYSEVAKISNSLRSLGIKPGDRIAGFLPNIPEAIIAMLAAASLGAVWSSTSPDFGVQGVLDRFGQIRPKVLFATDGYTYNGKPINTLPTLSKIVGHLDSLEKVIIVPYLTKEPGMDAVHLADTWEDFIRDENGKQIQFESLPFNHPLYIMYSSGTTGLPKSIVHGAGGTLLQHLKELMLHTDLKRQDHIFYFTTCGWMMWNWLVSSLAAGATVILYDGSPTFPEMDRLFRIAEEEKISVFGTSAKYLAAVEKAGLKPVESFDLSNLRTILSTGSPLSPESFEFVYEHIKSDLCLSSISGGTDIISCFALGCPVLPVWRGELQTRGLGMKVEIYDPEGHSLTGEQGELVCTLSFPSKPIRFWDDPDGSRYHQAYFDRYENVWHHGDFAEITEHGGLIIYGRSDAVLNPGGVRIGTAEIYRIVEALPEIRESICVGQRWENDVKVILFVILSNGETLDSNLIDKIRKSIRSQATPRHVPAKIIEVHDIPRTLNGKITEIAVRQVIHGEKVVNLDALANPEALDQFRDLEELKKA